MQNVKTSGFLQTGVLYCKIKYRSKKTAYTFFVKYYIFHTFRNYIFLNIETAGQRENYSEFVSPASFRG
ncbi:MAG: hypothetical protein CVT94_10845 [Bacteroidetes bacterium HGW-Bacteroidetes-11]|jgi:hypothetical protein|nr:MAG: hypothetical protein CVT94_10845 [Bacteroidetes bacterium HGW-Bacteroidetes-11]